MRNARIDAIGFFVDDLGKMVTFYRDVVGFAIDWDGGPYAEFKSEGVRFMMYPRKEFESLTANAYDYPQGLNGTFELAFDLPRFEDVDTEYQRLVAAGAKPVYAPKTEPWGMRSSYVADPEGNLLEIGSWSKGAKK